MFLPRACVRGTGRQTRKSKGGHAGDVTPGGRPPRLENAFVTFLEQMYLRRDDGKLALSESFAPEERRGELVADHAPRASAATTKATAMPAV